MLNRNPMPLSVRRTAILAVALVLVSLLLLLLDTRDKLDAPKEALSLAVSPLGEAFTRVGDRAAGAGAGDSSLRAELEAVTEERDQLLAENAQLKEVAREVDELRELLQFREAHPDLELAAADVISRDPQGREQYIVINAGSDDGIEVGMPVLSPYFLVGQVTRVEPDRAKVLLVIDSTFQTGARLQQTDAEGIVYGRWQEGGRVTMKHIPVDAPVTDGDLAVTSGKTEHVPGGLIIGKVMEVRRDELGNETQLEIVPVVDFNSLSAVTVVTGQTAPEATP